MSSVNTNLAVQPYHCHVNTEVPEIIISNNYYVL